MVIAPGTSVSGVFYCPFLMQTNMTSLQLNTKINIMYNNSDTEIIFSSLFEQRTPDKAKGFEGVLKHSFDKILKGTKIDVPIVYDKYGRFSKKDVEEGIKLFEQHKRIRFKEVIVISAGKRIHVHYHNN